MRKRLKFVLGTLTVFLLALMPSVVPVGGSIAPATAADCSPTEATFTGNGTIGSSGVVYQVLTFTSVDDCDWRVPSGVVSVDYLLVGGGGSEGLQHWPLQQVEGVVARLKSRSWPWTRARIE